MVSWVPVGAVVAAGVVAGCGGADGKDCGRYAEVTCEKACACSDDPGCQIVWGTRTYDSASRSECESTLRDVCAGERDFDVDGCLEMVEAAACNGMTFLHPICPLGGTDGGQGQLAVPEVSAPDSTPLDTVAIRGTAPGAERVAVELEGVSGSHVAATDAAGAFCVDVSLPADMVSTFRVVALADGARSSPPASVDVTQDAGASSPPDPTCAAECAADEDCGNDVDDDCNSFADECDPACNGCSDDDFEPNDVPFGVPELADGTYELALCPCREDWFAFDLVAGGSIGARAGFDSIAIDIDMALFRAADAESGLDSPVAASMTATGVEQIDYEPVEGGTYYLRVYSFRPDSSGSYTLAVGTTP